MSVQILAQWIDPSVTAEAALPALITFAVPIKIVCAVPSIVTRDVVGLQADTTMSTHASSATALASMCMLNATKGCASRR